MNEVVYLASDDGLLVIVFFLVVFGGPGIWIFIKWNEEKEKNRSLQIYLNLANNEVKRLTAQEKRLLEVEKNLLQSEKKLQDELYERKVENLRFALNPHSFKNTLNSIQTMAANTFESVRGLSATIDYMLYDGNEPYVLLEQELQFAQQYLGLFQKKLRPSFNIQSDISLDHSPDFTSRFLIAPLITAGFIENAFQHGETESSDAYISFKLDIIGPKSILYMVKNHIRQIPHRGKGGLGQKKMKERLELLYPSRHHLEYKNEGGIFTAILKLELHER